jgi:hypothetical protein
MNRFALSLLMCVLALAILTAIAPDAEATVITAGGTTVFNDNGFEGANYSVGTTPTTNSPAVGTWVDAGGLPNKVMQVVDTPVIEGSRSLHLQGGTSWRAHFAGDGVNPATTNLHVEFEYYAAQTAHNLAEFKFYDAVNENVHCRLYIGDNVGTPVFRAYGNSGQDLGLSPNPSAWNKVIVDWNSNAQTMSVRLNDGAPCDFGWRGILTPVVTDLEFRDGWDGGSYYIDSVPLPEPSTLVLTAMGLLGLVAYAWRKRR